MKTVKGVYTFKDTLTPITFGSQTVNFVSVLNGEETQFLSMRCSSEPLEILLYKKYDNLSEHVAYYYPNDSGTTAGWRSGGTLKNVDFGETPQTVSDEFCAWLVENTENTGNTQINITKNGTTTLATAGKYCDSNIDVNVDVPSNDAELEEQKAITDSILDKSITEYVNDTVDTLGLYAFAYCRSLTKIRCGAVTRLSNYCLRDCAELTEARFDSLRDTIGNQVFSNCSSLVKLILPSSNMCQLANVNAFQSTPIAKGTGYVYVPDDLVDSYKTATNWATYANQIKPISELEG